MRKPSVIANFIAAACCLASYGTKGAVGTSVGQFEVGASGNSRYAMPITVVPGAGGMEPKLGIQFDSQIGEGYLGPRFAISGLSQISRCGKTITQDGIQSGVAFGSGDQYCMDGQRLVSSSPGSVGAVYRLEQDNFSRARSLAGSAGDPGYFEVDTKAGLRMTYGGSGASCTQPTASRKVNPNQSAKGYIWMLSRVEDTAGNWMEYCYTYDGSTQETLPQAIFYTGSRGIGTSPFAKVEFAYRARSATPAPIGYYYGSQQRRTKTLSSISTWLLSNSSATRAYTFNYQLRGIAQREQLTSVQECAGSDCLPSTSFAWAADADGFASPVSNSLPNIGSDADQLIGDWDADGASDLIAVRATSSGAKALVVKRSTPTPPVIGSSITSGGSGTIVTLSRDLDSASFNDDWAKVAGDFNGDGRTDIALVRNAVISGVDAFDGFIYTASSASTFSSRIQTVIRYSSGSSDARPLSLKAAKLSADINHDSYTDILLVHTSKSNGTRVQAYNGQSNGTLYAAPIHILESTLPSDDYSPQLADVNGDALPDLVLIRFSDTTLQYRIYPAIGGGAFSQTPYVGTLVAFSKMTSFTLFDQNADGIPDIVAFCFFPLSPKGVDVFLGKGNGTFDARRTTTTSNAAWSTPKVEVTTDYNSDGFPDVVLNRSGSLDVLYGQPNGTFEEVDGVGSAPSGADTYGIDISGDGKADIVAAKTSDSGSQITVIPGNLGISNWLVSVTNGLGAKVKVEYRALTDNTVYKRTVNCGGANPRVVCEPIYVTAAVEKTNPGWTDRRTEFTYGDARADYKGRGFLGFAARGIFDILSGSKSVTSYRQDFPYIGVPTKVSEYASGNELVTETISVLAAKVTLSTVPQAIFPYVDTTTVRQYEISPHSLLVPYQSTVTRNAYEEPDGAFFGNVTTSETTAYDGDVGAGDAYVTQTVNQYDNDSVEWKLGRLTRAEVTRTSPGERAQTRSSSFTYFTNGLLKSETIEPDSADFKLVTNYQRDGIGNITRTDTAGSDGVFRYSTSNYEYGNGHFGRFVTSSCNAVQQCSASTYYPATGQIKSARDPNNLTTTFSSDNFGRRTGKGFNQFGVSTSTSTTYSICTGGVTGNCGARTGAYAQTSLDSTGYYNTVVYDSSDREINRLTLLPDLQVIEAVTDYSALGYVQRKSMPKKKGSSIFYWTTYTYDNVGRPLTETTPVSDTATAGSIAKYDHNGLTTTMTDPALKVSRQTVNSIGKVMSVVDNQGNSITNHYDPFENLVDVAVSDGTSSLSSDLHTRAEFDIRGRKTKITDPDLGVWLYEYSPYGELLRQRDAKLRWSTMTYDALGRMKTRTESEGMTTWYYDRDASNVQQFVGALAEVTSPNYRQHLTYFGFGGLREEQTTIDSKSWVTTHTYDGFGRSVKTIYSNGFEVQNGYTTAAGQASPSVQSVYSPSTNKTYWRGKAWDVWGHAQTAQLGNGLETNVYRDTAVGHVDAVTTGNTGGGSTVQSINYAWDNLGQLTYRNDVRQGVIESFQYDELSRLRGATICGTAVSISCSTPIGTLDVTYDGRGNIKSKNDANYSYNFLSPHAATFIGGRLYGYDANGNTTKAGSRTYTWTSSNMPERVRESGDQSDFEYGPSRERILQKVFTGVSLLSPGDLKRTVYYPAAGMEVYDYGGSADYKYSILTPDGVVAIQTWNTPLISSAVYLHRDHLGSVDTITNESGAVLQRLSYDAFGAARGANWSGEGPGALVTSYGFGGQEQIGAFGLVHMNGRIYDASIGRFISADPFIQDPNNTQSFNRYSYVLNNPLAMTDPGGFFSIGHAFKSVGHFLKDNWRSIAAIGVAILVPYAGAWIYGMEFATFATTGVGLASIAAGGFAGGLIASGGDLQAGLIGAWTAVAFVGVGNMYGSTLTSGRVAVHGAVGGISTGIQGGDFAVGFLSSGASAALAPMIGGPKSLVVRTSIAAAIGGTISEIGGNKFANGALSASYGYLFNDWLHGLLEAHVGVAMHNAIFQDQLPRGAIRGRVGKMSFLDGSVDLAIDGNVYEIKPVSYIDGYKYIGAWRQETGYVKAAGYGFQRGEPDALLGRGAPRTLTVKVDFPQYTDTYKMTYFYDPHPYVSGLVFYEKSLVVRSYISLPNPVGATSTLPVAPPAWMYAIP